MSETIEDVEWVYYTKKIGQFNNEKKRRCSWKITSHANGLQNQPYEEKVKKSRSSLGLKRKLSFYKRGDDAPEKFLKIQSRCIFISLHPETSSVEPPSQYIIKRACSLTLFFCFSSTLHRLTWRENQPSQQFTFAIKIKGLFLSS